jgi:hypothetical protein
MVLDSFKGIGVASMPSEAAHARRLEARVTIFLKKREEPIKFIKPLIINGLY